MSRGGGVGLHCQTRQYRPAGFAAARLAISIEMEAFFEILSGNISFALGRARVGELEYFAAVQPVGEGGQDFAR